MKRPDSEAILSPLKPFQRRTVDHAFERLFLAPDSTTRFLVADEVGLGKTLVARGVIAKAIDYYWDNVERIDIVYICSNQSIARSNLPKLQVTGEEERSFALATRLTMLATELAPAGDDPGLAGSKVNFVSFTPGTSFNMGNSGGMAKERRLIYQLLRPVYRDWRRKGLMNVLQGAVKKTRRFRYQLEHSPFDLEPNIRRRFRKQFRESDELRKELTELIEGWFYDRRRKIPPEINRRRNQVVGELRRMLADLCVQALEPDLIILDEFQRFKSMLEARDEYRDPAAKIAQALFNTPTPEGHRPRTLLLSATPYKLYTADAEIEHEDHYRDFIDTTRFLFDEDESRVQAMRNQLAHYGGQLKRAAQGLPHDVSSAKTAVQDTLKSIMARTERVVASEDRDAMVEDSGKSVSLQTSDIRQYMASDALFRAVGDRDPLVFWKSAPYLGNFMHGYKFNERLDEALDQSPHKVAEVLNKHSEAFLSAEDIEVWKQIDPDNAKLRELLHELIDGGLWKLLWVPPTVHYWEHDGAYRETDGLTKTLLFSAWNVVPDVVSGILSYEAERCMVGGSMNSYQDPDHQQSRLLRLSQSAQGSRSRHRLLLLLLPCLTLADHAHPLSAPSDVDRRDWVRNQVAKLLADPALPNPKEGPVDERWEWAIPVLLDPEMGSFLDYWCEASVDEIAKPNPEVLPGYIDDLLSLDPASLGRRPDDLVDLVTEVALGSPAVIAARMLGATELDGEWRRWYAADLAGSFWKLFNRPAVVRLLLQLAGTNQRRRGEDDAYWHQVLRYCINGNLQAVLDECWHLAWEQHAWSANQSVESICEQCIRQIAESVEPRPSRVHATFYQANGSQVEKSETRLRTVVAMRFGHNRSEEGMLSQDAVRAAFNSPFRPFVLTSTSIGQEGLDFHPWCHRLVHWNLPGNPVDMEQREGRVHRYKGHAVRRNVAVGCAAEAMARWQPGLNLWDSIFDEANRQARAHGISDLVPYWIATGPFKVQRKVPLLPYSQEVQAFEKLKRQLAAYRVVFGQPRQQELLGLLNRADIDSEELSNWAIDLSP